MTDKKKTEELSEKDLDAVQGGLYSTHGAGTELQRAPIRKPGSKGAPTPDGFIIFSETGH